MTRIDLELQREGGKVERMGFEGERVLIGSEAYCDVRLPIDEAAPEQLLLDVQGAAVRVTALATTPALRIAGQPVVKALITSGDTLDLGRLKIRVWLGRAAKTGKSTSLVGRRVQLAVGALIALSLGGLLLLGGDGKPARKSAAPPLWTGGSAACPTTQPREALAAAWEKRTLAEAKAQRQPFIAREGVEAVRLYRVAADCARVAGSKQRAFLTETADALQAAIDADYRVRRLRLAYSLKIGDKRTVAREASMLRELLRGKDDAYTRWLATLESKFRSNEGNALTDVSQALR